MKPESKQEVNAVVGKDFKKIIHEDGKTKTPYPIYPNEIRDDESSLGRFKSNTPSTEIKQEQEQGGYPYDYKSIPLENVSGSATYTGNPSPELIFAVNKMAEAAYSNVKKPGVLSKEEIENKNNQNMKKAPEILDEHLQGEPELTDGQYHHVKLAMEAYHSQFKGTEQERMFTESDLRNCFYKSRRKDDFDGTYEYAVFGDFLKTLNL